MRKLFYLLILSLMSTLVSGTAIVNNSGTTSEDSISVPVLALDSVGNPITADSFFVAVFKSNVNAVIFRDSGTIAMVGMDSSVLAGKTYYYYHREVAGIDGPGATGQYSGIITAKDNTGPVLTQNRFSFQIIATELSDQMDLVTNIRDSANALLDTLQLWATRIDSLEAALADANIGDKVWTDGAPAVRAQITEARDTLNTYDNAGRFQEDVDIMNRVIVQQTLTIDGVTPSVSGFSATELTQADNYWNDQMIFFLEGAAAGQAARITDFTAVSDSITFTPSLSVAPAVGDSVIILGLFFEAATLSGETMHSIADSTWAHIDTAWASGTMGDQLTDQNDTLKLVEAEVKNLNAWNPSTDSVNVDGSALAATTGAVSATTIAANAIGSSEIGTGAIDADAIATDAIGSAELAATAGTEIASVSADTVWKSLYTARNAVLGSFADSAKNWAATSASVTDTANIKTMLSNNPSTAGGWGTGIDMTLKSLIVSNSAGDAVQFLSTGANGNGLYSFGNGTGNGIYARGGGVAGSAGLLGYSASGFGFRALSDAAQAAFIASNIGTGHAMNLAATGGRGLVVVSAKNDGATFTGGDSALLSPHGIEILGQADDALRILARDPAAYGIRITADSAGAVYIKGGEQQDAFASIVLEGDTGLWINSALLDHNLFAIDTGDAFSAVAGLGKFIKDSTQGTASGLTKEAVAREVWTIAGSDDSTYAAGTMGLESQGWDAVGGTGSGAFNYKIYAIDSANVDTLMGVQLTVRTLAGSLESAQNTNSSGFFTFTLPADSFTVSAHRVGYAWSTLDTFSVTASATDSILGYRAFLAPAPPSGANLCNVYGWARQVTGDTAGVRYADVFFEVGRDVYNSCDSTMIPIKTQIAPIDINGKFSIDLIKSSCMVDANGNLAKYKVTIVTAGGRTKEHEFEIPADSSTYRLVF